MRFCRYVNQYWPLVIIAGAVVLGIPLLGIKSDFGVSNRKSLSDGLYQGSGYVRSSGETLMFGFDGVAVQAPMFQSWWDTHNAEAKLSELRTNTVVVGQVWKNNQGTKENNFKALQAFKKTGQHVLVQVTEMTDWVAIEKGTLQPHSFTLAKAARVFSQAKRAGVEKVADMIVLGAAGEEVSAYASYPQRKKMYELAKQYFPNLPVVQRYGVSFEKPEGLSGQPHPAGGIWNEYRFGADECDVALISTKVLNGVPVDQVVEKLNQQIALLGSRHAEAGILISVQSGSDTSLHSDAAGMVLQKDLEVLGAALLHSASVDGVLFRGMGEFPYDFGNPQFSAQRSAISRMAPTKPQVVQLQDELSLGGRAPASAEIAE